MPKAFTENEREWIKERLLEQGYKHFAAYGLRKTSIEELAEAAGISKGAFYLFYESKEALFMAVAERAEERYRQEILAAVDLPGPSPRARLTAVFQKAFALVKTIPILRPFTSSDYDLLFRKVSPEILQEHMASDRVFFEELIARCQNAGIPIRARPDEIGRLLYPLVLAAMHEDNFGRSNMLGGIEALLELVAAFCLGEVTLRAHDLIGQVIKSDEQE